MASDNPPELAQAEDANDNLQHHVWDAHGTQQAQMSPTTSGQWPQQAPGQFSVMTWDGFNIVEPQHIEQYLGSPLCAKLPNASYFEVQDHGTQAYPETSITPSNINHDRDDQPTQLSSGILSSQAKFRQPERGAVPNSKKKQPPLGQSLGQGASKNRKGKALLSHESSSSNEAFAETATRTNRPDTATVPSFSRGRETTTSSLKQEDDSPGPSQVGTAKDTLLQRNRMAASKFRHRKRDETKDLVADEKDLEQVHAQLAQCHNDLKIEVLRLKGLLLQHAHCDCVMIREYVRRESERILREAGREGNGASNEWPIDIHDVHANTGFHDFQ